MVTRARMFQYKPDGEVTLMTFQDALGTPITPFQDPLHYPHGTGFLAPGQKTLTRNPENSKTLDGKAPGSRHEQHTGPAGYACVQMYDACKADLARMTHLARTDLARTARARSGSSVLRA